MPVTDAPTGSLGGALLSRLMSEAGWVLAAAFAVFLMTALLARRMRPLGERVGHTLFGAPDSAVEPRARRFLRLSFGILWVVDGLLQAQSAMPTGFMPDVIRPQLDTAPSWLASLINPLADAWTRHPVAADAAVVWVQVGIGLLLLLYRRGRLGAVAAWTGLGWSLVVWVVGETFGGLFGAGATWSSGAPGAALAYAGASLLLLVPWSAWETGRAQSLARRAAAVWLIAGAALQAIPGERAWTADGASAPFVMGASHVQPVLFRRPIEWLASAAQSTPAAVNAVTIVLLAVAGGWLLISDATGARVTALAVCAGSWWLAQDFGVLGGTGTDPNAALPIGLLVATGLVVWRSPVARPSPADTSPAERTPGTERATTFWRTRLRVGAAAGALVLVAATVIVLPVLLADRLPSGADADALAADSAGGLRTIPPRSAPDFALVDQAGQHVSISALRGKIVVLTFLDAVCNTDCPLIANQLAIADRRLGPRGADVEFVAIDSNPVFHYRRDVAAFTQSHGLGDLRNWHFVSGDPAVVEGVLARYDITVSVPAVGMVEHNDAIYFITSDGREAAYLDDGASAKLTGTYADRVGAELTTLLR